MLLNEDQGCRDLLKKKIKDLIEYEGIGHFFFLLLVEEDDLNWRGKSQVENSLHAERILVMFPVIRWCIEDRKDLFKLHYPVKL